MPAVIVNVPQARKTVEVTACPGSGAAGTWSTASTVPLATRPSAVQGGPPWPEAGTTASAAPAGIVPTQSPLT